MVQLSHPYMTTGKTIFLMIQTSVSIVMLLFFHMLSRFVSFSSKEWVPSHFMATYTIHSDFGAQENKVCHCFHFSPIYLLWSDGTGCHDHNFWILSFKPAFEFFFHFFHSLSPLSKRFFSSSSLSAIRVVLFAYLRLLIFLPAILIPACDLFTWHFTWCTLHIS